MESPKIEVLYSKLYDKYSKLKNKKFNESDKLNRDQEEVFVNYASGYTTMNFDEEIAIIVLVMDYFYRKIRLASRVPQQVSNSNGKRNRASRVSEYESNMSALASVLVSRFDTDVSSVHSRQSGPRGEEMEEVVRIVGNLPDLTEQQIIHAFEFFRVNPDAVLIFLTMQERFRSGYIRSIVP